MSQLTVVFAADRIPLAARLLQSQTKPQMAGKKFEGTSRNLPLYRSREWTV